MQPFFSADEAIRWINGARWQGEKNGLVNTRALLDALGNPEKRMGRVVHVAGTNGKGSVCAFIERALRQCGYRTGLFTSPYLCFFHERVRLNGAPISDAELISVASRVRERAQALTEKGIFCTTFELLTAIACLYFAEQGTQYAVMEVGMGGRLDSTNVLDSSVAVIAAIGMDHMSRLGNTLEAIAQEKAGIIKPETPAVVMTQEASVMDVFRRAARDRRAPLFETAPAHPLSVTPHASRFAVELPAAGLRQAEIHLNGRHQLSNAALALTALDILGVDMDAACQGLARTKWPGRLEWIGNTLIDGAHNPQAAATLSDYLFAHFAGRRVVLLTGMMQDKQIAACAAIFRRFATRVVATQVDWPRALSAEALQGVYGAMAVAVPAVPAAYAEARRLAGEEGLVVVAGSIYLAGEVRTLLAPEDDGKL